MAAGRRAAAPEALEGPRPAAHARAAYRDAHPQSVKQLAGALPASTSLAMSEVGASGPHPSSTRAKRGSAARHSASGSPSSRRTMLAPRTIETIL